MSRFSVIFPAAGASIRFGQNKLTADLLGQPVIVRAVNAFLPREDVEEIVIATSDRSAIEKSIELLAHSDAILNSRKLRWCKGGETRAHTVQIAARAASAEWLAIHDAARPLVSQELIDRTFATAIQHGAAAPASPVHLTIKEADAPLPSLVKRTVPRQSLFAMQTPQCARRADLLNAYDRCPIALNEITDDVQLLELAGLPVMLVPGEDSNLKITTPIDLSLAGLWLRKLHSVAPD